MSGVCGRWRGWWEDPKEKAGLGKEDAGECSVWVIEKRASFINLSGLSVPGTAQDTGGTLKSMAMVLALMALVGLVGQADKKF